MNADEIRELAEAHWDWVRSLIEEFEDDIISLSTWNKRAKLFIDAFIHGYKHGKAGCKNDRKLVD